MDNLNPLCVQGLKRGLWLQRRKRFFADVQLAEGVVTAHCANTGSMRSLLHPSTQALLSQHQNPLRKLAYSLEFLELPSGALVCVHTQRPNAIVAHAFAAGLIRGFPLGTPVEREVSLHVGTRFDLRLRDPSGALVWVEVKNVTLSEDETPGVVSFPDAKTERGVKHLRELSLLASKGVRACMFYLVNRSDGESFQPASHIDPLYAEELQKAVECGVEVMVYKTSFQRENDSIMMQVASELPWRLV